MIKVRIPKSVKMVLASFGTFIAISYILMVSVSFLFSFGALDITQLDDLLLFIVSFAKVSWSKKFESQARIITEGKRRSKKKLSFSQCVNGVQG